MHPLIARQLGKTICYEKYLYFDLSKLKFWFERAWSLQALFQIFECHPNETKIVCITFYQFDVFSGPDPFKTCAFPFTYRGVTYNTCTETDDNAVCLFVSNVQYLEWYQSIHVQVWCSTSTSWGYCGPGCPTEDDVDVSECVDSLTHHYDDTDTPK